MTVPPVPKAIAGAMLVLVLAANLPAVAAAGKPGGTGAVLPGASNKEPISVDAAKLDYFDKEQKLIYSGDVVAKQGESTLKGSVLTIFLTKEPKKVGEADTATAAGPAAASSIDRMEVKGPVTVISRDEVGTGDNGSYDKGANRITLVGNVTLTQATNIIKGDKLVYDMNNGQAQVTSGQTQGRVKSIFTPTSSAGGPAAPKKPKAAATKSDVAGAPPQAAVVKTP